MITREGEVERLLSLPELSEMLSVRPACALPAIRCRGLA
jgi:hypothetical protein